MRDVRATKWQSGRLGTMGEIDIPDRVHRYVPLWVTQIAVAVSCAVLAFATRGAVDALFSGAGPFALTIPFVLFATLFARWQAGVLTLCLSMLYAWYFVLPVQSSFAFAVGSDAPRVVVNITSGFAVVALAEMFRRTVRRAVEERDAQVRERQLYLEEFDHRVKNNFAMVASLIRMESRRPGITEDARQSLNAIHGRVASISRAHQALYRREGGVQEVAMQTYLGELCTSLEQALLEGRRIRLQTHIAPVAVPRDRAISIGLLVNELVTNAVKHAFPEGRPTRADGDAITVTLAPGEPVAGADGAPDVTPPLRLVIEDNGIGTGTTERRDGSLGHQLIAAFAVQAQGTLREENPAQGTRFVFDFDAV